MTAMLQRAIVPSGAFTEDVLEDSGLINLRAVAEQLHQPIKTIAAAVGKSRRRVDEDPTAMSMQPKAALLLHVINSIAAAFNNEKRFAVLYINTEQPELGNRTPAQMLADGNLESLASYIDEVVSMRPD